MVQYGDIYANWDGHRRLYKTCVREDCKIGSTKCRKCESYVKGDTEYVVCSEDKLGEELYKLMDLVDEIDWTPPPRRRMQSRRG